MLYFFRLTFLLMTDSLSGQMTYLFLTYSLPFDVLNQYILLIDWEVLLLRLSGGDWEVLHFPVGACCFSAVCVLFVCL